MTKSTAGNTPLQLYPPKIKGQTSPVEPKSLADAGVSLAVHDLVPDGNGAHVDVDPPPKGQMQARDEMKLWIEGETAVLYSTIIVDPDAVTALRIPKGRLHPDKVNNLFYTIERNSGNEGTSSILRVLYNRIRPGLKDRYDSPGGHSELKLDLSELIRNGVGADFVSAQVCVSYPYCRAYDRITLKCNGELMHVNVAGNQAPQPPNPGSETPITICFTVTRAYLELAKREDQNLIFSFTVTDQLGNGPDTDAPWSPPQTVAEDLDGKLLPKAVLREIEDDTSDDPEIIDLEKLGDKKLTVAILTSDARFQVDDNIEALYTASRAGLPDITEQLSGTVEKGVFEPKAPCILKVTNAKVVADSIVTVVYQLFRSKDPIGKSNPAKATVIGTHMELKPPSVQQANGNTLAPMAAVSKLTIVVPQGTTLPTDLLSVSWIPEPGTHVEGTYVSDPRPISEVGLNADAPPALVAFCLGGKVTVSYTITRGNGQPKPSDPFILNVQELPQAELFAPRLKEASNAGEGTELNLAELTPEGKMWCSGFPFNAVGQYVWLLFKGTKADGSAYEKYIWAAPFAFVNDDWVRNGYFEATAPYEDLKGLKDGMPLTMELWVAFGKSEDLGLAKRFLIRTYIVSAVEDVAPTIDSVKGSSSGSEIPNNEITTETAIVLSGSAANGQQVEVFDGKESKGKATASDTGVWNHPDNNLVEGDHSYKVEALYGTGQVSAERNLTVVPALSVDTSPVNLSGRNYTVDLAAVGWELTGTDLPDTAVTRTASGGKAPYTYISSAPGIASVDSNGRIRSVSNGAATIIVSDALGQSREIPVLASNVQKILYGGGNMSEAAAQSWMVSVGGSPFPPIQNDYSQFNQKFRVLGGGVRRYFRNTFMALPTLPMQTSYTHVSSSQAGMVPSSTGLGNYTYSALCIVNAN